METDVSYHLPNLIIGGVAKAGTTSVFGYLAEHPDVYPSDVKELRYFTPLRYGESLMPIAEYARHFDGRGDERYTMEATPGYFPGGAVVAEAIRETLPAPKVMVVLREPADRCWSYFRFVKSRVRIPKDMSFSDYLNRCEELHMQGLDSGQAYQPFWGLGGGCYSEWINDWFDVFGDDFRVFFFDDLVSDPAAFMTEVCRWLDLDTNPLETISFTTANKSEAYRNSSLQNLALSVNRSYESVFRRYPRVKKSLWAVYDRVNHRTVDELRTPEDDERMARFYGPYSAALAAALAQRGLSTGVPPWVR